MNKRSWNTGNEAISTWWTSKDNSEAKTFDGYIENIAILQQLYKINAQSKNKKTKEKGETLRTKNVRYCLQQLIHLSRFRQITIGVYVAVFLFRRHFCRNLSELSFFVSQSHARRRNRKGFSLSRASSWVSRNLLVSFPSLSHSFNLWALYSFLFGYEKKIYIPIK